MLEAVTIIIDRLASHPEDFFGELGVNNGYPPVYGPRFNRVRSDLEVLVNPLEEGERPRFWYLNEEERAALREAYTNACRERFQSETLYTLLNQEQPAQYNTATMAGAHGTITNLPSSPQYMIAPASIEKTARAILSGSNK